MADSLADLIRSESWEKALFTTYSLSLTFFESILLRELRQSGCRDIWIAVDGDGYRSSLMERRSHSVGQEYHLVPLVLPNGVFHPKCCYLVGDSHDVLAIGSGNLTFGGFGRNIEVLDILASEEAPICFGEFGEFLSALKRRADIMCPNRSWIDLFANRALQIANGAQQQPSGPKLIHSTETPITDQLADLLTDRGSIEHLTVLSPFHDSSGLS